MARQKYKDDEGDLPGVTTILGQEDGAGLIAAANRMGLKGEPCYGPNGAWSTATAIGTACHERIAAHISGVPLDRSKSQLDKGFNTDAIWDASVAPYGSFLTWREGRTLTGQCEVPLIHPKYRYGGTLDFLARDQGVFWDWKTSKPYLFKDGLPKLVGQIAAYWGLCEANGIKIDSATVVRFPKEGGPAEELLIEPGPMLDAGKDLFLSLHSAWKARGLVSRLGKK